MSRFEGLLRNARRGATLVRTLRHLRPVQLRAQLGHALFGLPAPRRAPGSAPRLAIEVPATPFLPPPAHVASADGLSIELLATRFDLAERVDWQSEAHGPLFAYHLHQHEYLRLEAFSPSARVARMLDWVANHRAGVGWDPHPISLRLLCWGKLWTTPGALRASEAEREILLASLADQAETLAHALERRLQANHLLSNLLSVVWAGMLLDGRTSSEWRAQAEPLLAELEAQIRLDGGHEERSPMYHSLLLENLLDLLNLLRAAPERAPSGMAEALSENAARMLSALEVWTHPDGQIALFGDSAFGVAAAPRALRDYAARLGVVPAFEGAPEPGTGEAAAESEAPPPTSRLLAQTGYVRLVDPRWSLVASVAGPAPAHQPGHAHCDALAFELSLGDRRVVTDTGLYEYRPGARRDRARATASHATLQVDGQEQAEIWAAHRVGGRPQVELTAFAQSGAAEATCRGWSRRGVLHRRTFELEAGLVRIRDRVEGDFEVLRSRLPIAPEWEVVLEAGCARLSWRPVDAARSQGGMPGSPTPEATAQGVPRIAIELPAAFAWTLERAAYYPSFGREVTRAALVGVATDCEEAEICFRVLD